MAIKKIALFCPYLSSLGGGEKVALSIAGQLSKNNYVDIISEQQVDLDKAFGYFGIKYNAKNVSLKEANYTNTLRHYLARFIPLPKMRFIFNHHYKFELELDTDYDLFINNAYYSYLRPALDLSKSLPSPESVQPAKKSFFILMFPQEIKTLPADKPIISIIENWIIKNFFNDYNHIDQFIQDYDYFLANSKFTASVAQTRWGVKSSKLKILYPICNSIKKREKENLIISVGRIFPTDRYANNKNYEFMINSFKKLSFLHPRWRYLIIGTCSNNKRDINYLKKLVNISKGYPIDIIANASAHTLEEYIGKASIMWHACGYPQAHDHPENKEHFGISVVEAMSAGCVPIAYRGGGLKETINVQSGILWDNEDELIDATSSLINQRAVMSKLSRAAQKRSAHYNESIFLKNINIIFKEYL